MISRQIASKMHIQKLLNVPPYVGVVLQRPPGLDLPRTLKRSIYSWWESFGIFENKSRKRNWTKTFSTYIHSLAISLWLRYCFKFYIIRFIIISFNTTITVLQYPYKAKTLTPFFFFFSSFLLFFFSSSSYHIVILDRQLHTYQQHIYQTVKTIQNKTI